MNKELRSRNPLHPQILDNCILGNLINFPKHIFGFPFGSYATDGNESLSLLLLSYREEHKKKSSEAPLVLYVIPADCSESDMDKDEVKLLANRICMEFDSCRVDQLKSKISELGDCVATVVTSFEPSVLGSVAETCTAFSLSLHVHVRDREWRRIFTENKELVHFELPPAIRSMTIEEGLFNSGYQLYRDSKLRDGHFDVALAWQTVYLSPNEGGSGQSAPLFMDFCLILLGWSTLHQIAAAGLGFQSKRERDAYRLDPVKVAQGRACLLEREKAVTPEKIKACAREWISPDSSMSYEDLQIELTCFQREFVGGKQRDLEVVCSGGGTRSINYAIESVLKRAHSHGVAAPKIVTGNPHLAVERAERRLGFELVRIDADGAISLSRLKEEIRDPSVVAVYSQTLSYTDGITDPLPEIVEIIEAENKSRSQRPITLINDSCLAFSVLLRNDGQNSAPCMRVFELTDKLITPAIVTLDAHKHLGTDKGVSTAMGTTGTLSNLKGHVKVGAQPSREDLARAIADVWLVGKQGYHKQYLELGEAIDKVVQAVKDAGMKVVHSQNRVLGSTVIAVEDPSGFCERLLKKKGHKCASLFGLCPEIPARCQSGWQISFTPYALRKVDGENRAIDVLVSDIAEIGRKLQGSYKLAVSRALFRENSLPAVLISGNIGPLLQMLRKPGYGRNFWTLVIRRYFTANLDHGVICSLKRPALVPLLQIAKRTFLGVFLAFVAMVVARRRRQAKRLKL
eukprot:TRINITY_DN11048_c0_g1_i3.p1 TRINITY_DN11048_c0_g1~~TRINITY_DN11048_c0_g1_i3.p1  ORF type:complete len:742 (-),score=119.78 TRINITY_DN11048_c0_g1_i3:233-2458(-)